MIRFGTGGWRAIIGSGTYPSWSFSAPPVARTVDMIHNTRNAHFGGHHSAPSATALAELRTRVVAGKYELGIAFDGAGDRLGIIDAATARTYIQAFHTLFFVKYAEV